MDEALKKTFLSFPRAAQDRKENLIICKIFLDKQLRAGSLGRNSLNV